MLDTLPQTIQVFDARTGEILQTANTDALFDLAAFGFVATTTGLSPAREITIDEWGACEPILRHEMDSVTRRQTWVQFAYGDWLNYGEAHFGENEIWNVIDPNKYDPHTLKNFQTVARRVHPSRRRENLTYSHHVAVAPLEASAQVKLLDEAEQTNLSAAAIAEKSKAARGLHPAPRNVVTCPNCQCQFEI